MIDFSKFNSLFSIASYFSTDDVCKQTIIESRWGKDESQDVVCPYCGKHQCKMSKSGRFHCTACNKHLRSYIDEACFRWNTRKMSESERFTDMFNTSVGLVKPNNEFKLCIAA